MNFPIQDLFKIMYDKEPDLHEYYIDFKKKRFYKCYKEGNKESFYNEITIFDKLADSKHIPELYDYYETRQYYVLEMELLPYPSLYGYTKWNTPWDNQTYSKEQIISMARQWEETTREIEHAGLVSQTRDVFFELGKNNIIYDIQRDRLIIYDFAKSTGNFDWINRDVIATFRQLPRGLPNTFMLSEADFRKFYITPGDVSSPAYALGQELKVLFRQHGPGTVYQSVFLNGELFRGQLATTYERMEQINFHREDFNARQVIDIGCNIGDVSAWAARMHASSVIGIEGLAIQAELAQKYINYLQVANSKTGDKVYHNIQIVKISALDYVLPPASTVLYFGCFRHFGTPEFHKRMGDAASVIYFGGHGLAGEKETMEGVLPQFGSFTWEYIGSFDADINTISPRRPVFRGVKNV